MKTLLSSIKNRFGDFIVNVIMPITACFAATFLFVALSIYTLGCNIHFFSYGIIAITLIVVTICVIIATIKDFINEED